VDLVLNEIINIQEESWTTVQRRSKGKAQRERTGLFRNNGSEIYNDGTANVEVVQEHEATQIEIDEEKENRQRIRMDMLNRPKDDGQAVGEAKSAAQKRYDKKEGSKKAADKAQLITERSDAKQKMLSERQTMYMEELALKHELQQQEGRYIKAPSYPMAASENEADRPYRKQATEMAADMMKAGTRLRSRSCKPRRLRSRSCKTGRIATSCPRIGAKLCRGVRGPEEGALAYDL
jgi:hypothetical protein